MTTILRSLKNREEEAARRNAAYLALYGGIAVLAGKTFAYFLTDSTAVLSDALESTVNVVTALFLVYSIRLSSAPADRDHPYGHGKIEFFAAGVEGTLIAVAAVLIMVAATYSLWYGPQVRQIDLGVQLLIGFSLVNAAIGWHLLRVGERVDSMALRADGLHLLTDVLTSVGVVVGLIAVRVTGIQILDPLMAILVAMNILRTGWKLSRTAIKGLMDEADDELLESITKRLEVARKDWCIDVHSLRTWSSGNLHHVDFHLTVPRYYDAERLHEVDEEYKADAFATDPRPWDAIIHYDPCRPRHCSTCPMSPCHTRSDEFKERVPLQIEDCTRTDESLDEGVPL